jgi:HK97 family phage major capsid protein
MAKSADDLRRERKAAADAMEAAAQVLAEAADDAALTAAQAEFDKAEAAFKTADRQVKAVEAAEAARAAAATPANHRATGAAPGATVPAMPDNKEERALVETGLLVQALVQGKGDRDKAVTLLDREGHSGVSAALSGATEAAGGVTVPRPLMQGLIGLLGARTVVRRAGAVSVPMPAGQIRAGKMLTGPTASYIAENAAITESEPTFGPVDQAFKTLTGLVPIGNPLLSHTSVALASLVGQELVTALSRREDLAFIRNDGTGNTPIGLRNWAAAGQWAAAAVAATAAAAEAAIRATLNRVEDKDVPMDKGCWIMRASAKNFLASLRDTNGNYVFPLVEDGELMGFPIFLTSQIPTNLGAGTETEIYFAAMDQWMIGEDQAITLAMSSEASYVDSGGNTISAFQRDLTLLRAVSRHDFAPKYTIAVAGFNGTAWTI